MAIVGLGPFAVLYLLLSPVLHRTPRLQPPSTIATSDNALKPQGSPADRGPMLPTSVGKDPSGSALCQIAEAFSREQDKWYVLLEALKEHRFAEFRLLIEDDALLALGKRLRESATPEMLLSLQKFCAASRSELGELVLLVLAATGRPENREFLGDGFRKAIAASSHVAALHAWGLCRIGEEQSLDCVADHLRRSSGTGQGLERLLEYSLATAGELGFERLRELSEQVALRVSLASFEERPWPLMNCFAGPFEALLAKLVETHPSNTVRLCALQPLLTMRKPESTMFAVDQLLNMISTSQDPVLITQVRRMLCRNALGGSLHGLSPETRDHVIAAVSTDPAFTDPSMPARIRFMLDPDGQLSKAREILLGPGSNDAQAERTRRIIVAELAKTRSPQAAAILQEYAASSGTLTTDELQALAQCDVLAEPKLVDLLVQSVAETNDQTLPRTQRLAIEALSKFDPALVQGILPKLNTVYERAWIPQARVIALEGFSCFGDAGREALRSAANSGDDIGRLVAFHGLLASSDEGSRADDVRQAKAFLAQTSGNRWAGLSRAWASYLGGHFVGLFRSTFISGGHPSDLPWLRQVAESPRIPMEAPEGRMDRLEESLRAAALTAIEVIESRKP